MIRRLEGTTAWITGASAGIGEATARVLAEEGAGLVLFARRRDKLETLAVECLTLGAPAAEAVALDVQDHDAVKTTVESLGGEVDILINNAGLSRGLDPVHSAQISDWDEMIDTNIKGLLYMTRYTTPRMLTQGRGHVVNIGSIAGHEVYPGGSVYCATKYAVAAISRGTRLDLLGTGVKVSLVSPGLVNTEFSKVRFHGDQDRADTTYNGMTPLVAVDIAEAIRYAVTTPAEVCIEEVLVYPRDQGGVFSIHRRTE